MKVGLGVSPAILRVFANLLFFCHCVEPHTVEGSNDHHPEAKITPPSLGNSSSSSQEGESRARWMQNR